MAMWFRDDHHYDAWFGEGTQRGNDGFFDVLEPGAGASLKTTENVVVDGEASQDSEKVVYFVKRGAHVTTDALFAHWRDRHAPNVAAAVERTEGCLRYVISHADLGVAGSYDGIAEIWWSSAEARRAGLQGVEDDGFGALIDREQTVTIAGSERPIVG
ncbi:MAG: hypothetical protein QF664_04275 [Dehalococcoidia bacterium]|nr:hypothetical protein [Dehalococcoidia bacterium]